MSGPWINGPLIDPGAIGITGGSIATPTTGVATLLAVNFAGGMSAGNDITEDTLATVAVPANLLGANGSLRIWSWWTITNSVNNKTLRIRYSGGAGAIFLSPVITTQNLFRSVVMISNRGATNSQIGNEGVAGQTGGLGVLGGSAAFAAAAVDMTAATSIVFTGQKALNTETITLEGYMVEVIH